MRVPPELLQKIKDAVNIVEVVGETVVLRKSGANHTGLCPFHSERTPSFSVSENKQVYHCYGCKKSGDLFSFVMDTHGISFPEAVEELAEKARIPLPKTWGDGGSGGDPEVEKRRAEARERTATAHKLNRFVAAFFHQSLKQLPAASAYFAKRGVSDEMARSFYVGAAHPSWDALASHLIAKKAPLPLAVELGLIRPSQKGQTVGCGYFDLFRNRVMFPILDIRGKVVGFGGRDLGDDGPKYLNSPESVLFQKSKLAFGLYQAQKHIREKDEVIIVEGYFDVVALHAAGFQNVVATCGTSLSPEHLAIFQRFAKRITILFDGDKAGISATERAMELGLDHGLILQGAVLPPEMDPDEILFDQETGLVLSDGQIRMTEILQAAQPLLDSRLSSEISTARQGPEAQTQALKRIGGWLSRYKDPVGREVRVGYVQKQMGISRDLLVQAMGSGQGRGSRVAPEVRAESRPEKGGRPMPAVPRSRMKVGPRTSSESYVALSSSERILLGGLARGADYSTAVREAGGKLPPDQTVAELFDYPPAKELVLWLLQQPEFLETFHISSEQLTGRELDSQVRSTLTESWMATQPLAGGADFQAALEHRIGRQWARFSQRIKAALERAEANKDAGLQERLLKEYLDVRRKMEEFKRFYDEA